MKNLQSLLPALIIALAVLAGLLGGAKIISDGVVEANRFQVIDARTFFDSATGGVFTLSFAGWEPLEHLSEHYLFYGNINSPKLWVEYLWLTKEHLKKAEDFYD
jgi:hypothetical protein